MGPTIQYSDERELPVQQPLFMCSYDHWITKQNGGSFAVFYEQQLNENILRDQMMLLEAIKDLSEYIKR